MDILAFFAHPDDETILAGGTLALLSRLGAHVHYLCATRGEGGETGEPPLCTEVELGAFRQNEMACAVEQLGGTSLAFLDYTDPRVGMDNQLFPYAEDLNALTHQVTEVVRQVEADAIITHGSNGEYGHPAHILTHKAVQAAVESMTNWNVRFYGVAASFPEHPRPRIANQDDPAHLILDITPVLEAKTLAALCHQTQHALFVRRASQEAGRPLSVPEVIQRLESLHRFSPPMDDGLEDELAQLMRDYLVITPQY